MFSVVFGTTIGKMKEKGKPLQDFFVSLSEAMMIITSWVIWYNFHNTQYAMDIAMSPVFAGYRPLVCSSWSQQKSWQLNRLPKWSANLECISLPL